MNLSVVSRYSGDLAYLNSRGGTPGATVIGSGDSFVNSFVLFNGNPNPFSTNIASRGTVLGRVGAHEVIQHGFLGVVFEGLIEDITRSLVGAMALFERNTSRWDVSAFTAADLSRLCPPTTPTRANHELLHVGGGGPGSIGPGFIGGGYPGWWYSMWNFVSWVNSIPVGRRPRTTVTIIDLDEEFVELW